MLDKFIAILVRIAALRLAAKKHKNKKKITLEIIVIASSRTHRCWLTRVCIIYDNLRVEIMMPFCATIRLETKSCRILPLAYVTKYDMT